MATQRLKPFIIQFLCLLCLTFPFIGVMAASTNAQEQSTQKKHPKKKVKSAQSANQHNALAINKSEGAKRQEEPPSSADKNSNTEKTTFRWTVKIIVFALYVLFHFFRGKNKSPEDNLPHVGEVAQTKSDDEDWGELAFAAYERGDFLKAVQYWDNAIDEHTVPEVIAQLMYNKGCALSCLEKHEEAIETFGALVSKYDSDPSSEVRLLVADARTNIETSLDALNNNNKH